MQPQSQVLNSTIVGKVIIEKTHQEIGGTVSNKLYL